MPTMGDGGTKITNQKNGFNSRDIKKSASLQSLG